MAPVILSMDVHCDSCAKKIRKAVMKVPGAESVSASYETGLVVVEGTADAETLRARLQAKTKKDVNIVSDGAEDSGEVAGDSGSGSGSGSASPPPSHHSSPPRSAGPVDDPAPIILEMELHGRGFAKKVERLAMEIPGVDAVSTDVQGSRVEVTGTADASAVATSLEVRMGRPVRVVSDPRSSDDAPGYDHEWRKAAAARAAAERMQELYGPTEEPTDASSFSSLFSAPPSVQRAGSSLPPSPPPESSYGYGGAPPPPPESSYGYGGAPPPPTGYYCPPPGEMYGGQYWAPPPPAPPTGGYYMHQEGQTFGEQWPGYGYPPPPGAEPEGYYNYGGQQGENPGSCSIQ